jgi:hypothetical protein
VPSTLVGCSGAHQRVARPERLVRGFRLLQRSTRPLVAGLCRRQERARGSQRRGHYFGEESVSLANARPMLEARSDRIAPVNDEGRPQERPTPALDRKRDLCQERSRWSGRHGVSVAEVANADEPRFLAKGLGYVRSGAIAMDKVEAVSEGEQRRQTDAAHRRWRLQQAREWGQARREILSGVERFKHNGHPDPRLLHDLRGIERGVERVDRRVGL